MLSLRCFVAALLLSGAASGAAAQDGLGSPVDWTGPYFGFAIGGLRSEGQAVRDRSTGDLIAFDIANGLFPAEREGEDLAPVGGVGAGWNIQRDGLVGGLEFDFMFAQSEVTEQFSRIDPNPDPAFNGVITETSYGTEIDNLMTLRIRAGLARGRSLFYATGGIAAGEVTNRFTLDLPNLSLLPGGYHNGWSSNGIRIGYVIGAGLEHRLSGRTSVKAELFHFDLEDVTIHAEDPPIFGDNSIDYRFKNDGQVLRLGLNLHF